MMEVIAECKECGMETDSELVVYDRDGNIVRSYPLCEECYDKSWQSEWYEAHPERYFEGYE